MFRNALLPLALLALSGAASAALIDSGTVNLVIPNNTIGLYVNVVDGTTYTGPSVFPVAGGPGFDYDLNIYGGTTATTAFTFYSPTTSGQSSTVPATSKGYVSTSATGGVAALALGTVIGGASTFNTGSPSGALVSTGTPAYFGFRFRRESDDTVHYGYAQVILTQGQPGTLVRYAYESTPLTAVTVSASPVPEPATLAALGLGAAALLRRKRRSA